MSTKKEETKPMEKLGDFGEMDIDRELELLLTKARPLKERTDEVSMAAVKAIDILVQERLELARKEAQKALQNLEEVSGELLVALDMRNVLRE